MLLINVHACICVGPFVLDPSDDQNRVFCKTSPAFTLKIDIWMGIAENDPVAWQFYYI